MQNNQSINLAIIGIGNIGKRHLMAINAIENVNLCGIVDLTEDAREFCNSKKISLFDNERLIVATFAKLPSGPSPSAVTSSNCNRPKKKVLIFPTDGIA